MRTSSSFSDKSCSRMSRTETTPRSWLPSQMSRCRNPCRRMRKRAGFHVLARTDGERVRGHDIAHASLYWVAAFDHDPAHEIALGKHAYQHSVPQYGNGADVTFDHGSRHVQHTLLDIGVIGILTFDEIVDARHVAPPATRMRSGARGFESLFARSIRRKGGEFKSFSVSGCGVDGATRTPAPAFLLDLQGIRPEGWICYESGNSGARAQEFFRHAGLAGALGRNVLLQKNQVGTVPQGGGDAAARLRGQHDVIDVGHG